MATANLSWSPSAGATSYKIEYKLSGAGSYTLYNAALTSTSVSISDLLGGTAYDFRVTSNCTTGSSGGTITSGNTPCLDVNSLTVGFTGTTANLSWSKSASAVTYTILYKLHSAGSFTTATGSPLSNTGQPDPVLFDIPGLTAGNAYDFEVIVNCSIGSSTGIVTTGTTSCPSVNSVTVTFS